MDINQLILLAQKNKENNKIDEAKKIYLKILDNEPANYEANNQLGILYLENSEFELAEKYFFNIIEQKDRNEQILNNYGISLLQNKKFRQAIEVFNEILIKNKNYSRAYNNRGLAYQELDEYDNAITDFKEAISLETQNNVYYNNIAYSLIQKSVILQEPKLLDLALTNCRASVFIEDSITANLLIGDIFFCKKIYHLAVDAYELTYNRFKFIGDRLSRLILSKLYSADWNNISIFIDIFKKKIMQKEYAGEAMPISYFLESPKDQMEYMSIHTQTNQEKNTNVNVKKIILKKKIHIGYFSSDFKNHPVGQNIIGILKKHNVEKFEIFFFSFSNLLNQNNAISNYVKNSKNFVDLYGQKDFKIQNKVNECSIDIAVDLNGLTEGGRPDLFYKRVAPIQIHYLGTPLTLGSGFFDYIIADKNIITEDTRKYYFEKIIYLPKTLYSIDYNEFILRNPFSKVDANTVEKKFIFGCLNNFCKINKNIFQVWLNILNKVPNSELWLSGDTSIETINNLIRSAEYAGIKKERFFFAKRLPSLEEHLARIQNVDLFLDTYPYGGHTTVMDFLYANVPILTLKGDTFSSRVGYSLLKFLALEEDLVSNSQEDYEQKAIKIAQSPELLKKIKNKINLYKDNLFRSDFLTQNLEKAFEISYDLYKSKKIYSDIDLN